MNERSIAQRAVTFIIGRCWRRRRKGSPAVNFERASTQKLAPNSFGVRHAALPRGDVNGSQSKGHVFPKPRTRGCAFDFSNRGNAVNDGYFLKSVGAENAFPQNALEPIFSNC